jgi:hypothetical protein
MAGKQRIEMDVAVSRLNTLYYERTLMNYWNRAKEKHMDSWYFCWDSKSAMQKQRRLGKRAGYSKE